ncbi:MAG: BrnT family toxin [Chloroflexi bacterium]|nr:BrnT family toxin [Chloroflexota bacterium]
MADAPDYQWNPDKAQANLRKHRVDFADAVSVFADEAAITVEDEYPGEEHFVTIGTDAFGRILVVVYAWRGDSIRLISARKATARERRQYEE